MKMVVGILAVACMATLAAAHAPLRDEPGSKDGGTTTAPVQSPPPAAEKKDKAADSAFTAFGRLVGDHRKRVERAAKYYVRLDDGTCLNIFRLVRAIELREDEKALRREEMLEALGALRETGAEPPPPGNQLTKYEKLPPWVEYREFCYVFGPGADMTGFSTSPTHASDYLTWLNTGRVYRDGVVVSFGSYTDVYISGMTMNFAVPRRLEETILLAPSGAAAEGQHPALKVYRVMGRQPTPEQLAEYLVKNNRPLIEYEIPPMLHHQPTKARKVDHGLGWVETKYDNDGPSVHTYKWVKREFKLRLDPSKEAGPTKEATPISKPQ